jgi:hypothetical protein
MRGTPTPLWIFAAVGIVSWTVALSSGTTPLPAALGTSAFAMILLVLLLRGSRVVWALLVLDGAVSLLLAPVENRPPRWSDESVDTLAHSAR